MNDIETFLSKHGLIEPQKRESILAPFQAEILALKEKGFSDKVVVQFLEEMKGVKVSQQWLNRYIRSLKQVGAKQIEQNQPEPQPKVTPTEPKEQAQTPEQPSVKPATAKPENKKTEQFEQPTTPGYHTMPDGSTVYINNKGENPFIDKRTGRRRFPSLDEIDAEHLI